MMTTTFKWMAMGAVLGFSVAMGVSCGPAKCTPSNCAFGCCDAKDVCQMGSADSQCGISGATCSACQLGTQCRLGICISGNTGGGNGGGNGGGGATGGGTGGGATGGGTGGGATGGGTGGGATGGGTGGGGVCRDPGVGCSIGSECCSGTCQSGVCGGVTGGGTGGGVTGGGIGGGGIGGGTGGGIGGGTGGGVTGGGIGGGTGGGVTGGGGGTTNTCPATGTAFNTFMAGRATCTNGEMTVNADPNVTTRCVSNCSSTGDQSVVQSFGTCLAGAQVCTTGNEDQALSNFQSCTFSLATASPGCQTALLAGQGTGGGTGGGGGAPVGGGTGGGGGTTACTTISTFTTVRGGGQYDSAQDVTVGVGLNTATDPTDQLQLELWWNTATLPITRNLSTSTYNTCPSCAVLRRGCVGTSCSGGEYLGRTGTMTVTAATQGPGTFSGSISGVRFDEWDLANDAPITGGRCVEINSGSVSVQVP